MNEHVRQRPRTGHGNDNPGGLGSLFDMPASDAVTVTHGPYAESLPVNGMTVEAVRERYRDRFDIDPRSQAIVDGHPVGDETEIRAGQTLSFITRSGEKGGHGCANTVRRGEGADCLH